MEIITEVVMDTMTATKAGVLIVAANMVDTAKRAMEDMETIMMLTMVMESVAGSEITAMDNPMATIVTVIVVR